MKTNHIRESLLVLCIAGTIMGCASIEDVVREKNAGGGTTRVYPVSQEQAWDISRSVLRWEGAEAIIDHRDQGCMLTDSGPGPSGSPGSFMGAWVESAGKEQTRVTVVTKRRMLLEPTTTLTESTYHARFSQAVEMVKAGKILPLSPPD
jgi:hypothetical protein